MKMITRFISLMLAFIMTAASLASCHGKRIKEETTLSDDLYSYQISIDGHVYSLPCPVSEFAGQGWNIYSDQEPATEFLDPGESDEYCCVRKGNERIEVEIYNANAQKAALADCTVVSVRVHASKYIETILPGGLPLYFDTTEEKLLGAYGEPYKKIKYNSSNTYYYIISYNKMIKFDLFIPDKTNPYSNNYVYIVNRKIENDLSKPDYTSTEKVTIADNPESCQVCIDSHVFTDPFILNDYIENGWTFKGMMMTSPVEPKSRVKNLCFEKDTMRIWIDLYNPSEQPQPAESCPITEVRLEFTNGFKYLILPGNFIFDKYTAIPDIINQYGEPTETDDRGEYTLLSYRDNEKQMEFKMIKEDGAYPPSFATVTLRNFVE